jgi:PPOX class probable F420-dependent enzyme
VTAPNHPDRRRPYADRMEIPKEARRRIAEDRVVWLTTVTDSGVPAPNPVWFVPDGEDLVVYTSPTSRRVHNLTKRPVASLHFNSDPHGGDVVVITADVEVTHRQRPSAFPGYLAKYEADILGPLATTVEAIDETYHTQLRLHPRRIRLTS